MNDKKIFPDFNCNIVGDELYLETIVRIKSGTKWYKTTVKKSYKISDKFRIPIAFQYFIKDTYNALLLTKVDKKLLSVNHTQIFFLDTEQLSEKERLLKKLNWELGL